MRAPFVRRVALAALLVSSVVASAQRQAVKDEAGDASATKTAPPAHSEPKQDRAHKKKHGHNGAGKTGVQVASDSGTNNDESGHGGDHEANTRPQNAYEFGLPSEDGKNLPLSQYKGKVLLIVNLGRESGFASQLPALEKLHDRFKEKGLVVLGVPSNDFGDAEPGTPADVAKYYTDAKVNFPVMSVSSLTGVHELPLFTYLSKSKSIPDDGLHWNYTKFVVDRNGKVILRFPPEVTPDSLQMMASLQEVLDGTWKPKKPAGEKEETGGGDDDDD